MHFGKPILLVFITFYAGSAVKAQYKEPEKKDKIETFYPKVPFDSLQAKQMLAKGKATIKGVAFTKPKSKWGFKVGQRIYANQIKITLFPVTPYLESWYALRKEKENLKKSRYVYLSNDAYRYRLEAITNSDGEFTFPNMKPGKYFLQGFLGYTHYGTYNEYTGSGYNSYGGQTDYYQQKTYSVDHEDRIEEFVEIKQDGEIVRLKLN
ncbi:carboxypeptidase-like regulatory domain-containing protein [Chitinophaga sancti]|uniref:carboxypeptidase-like regulatory domain-containing protein n=1 Tax=Chitinophaga sancti TaxID=1004 RepID=UPI002A74EC3C|nr:carboxypeptidase-like regulatory domain-containing protein [Chitinophaga sancti]WPQ62052.1 carboxypeptidase-like regulatory domain-containing protein [Chitinophaga sancti]